jgi:hypothetical protein
MGPIALEFHTQDEAIIDLCRRYWAMSDAGGFTHTLDALKKSEGLSAAKLAQLVRHACFAYAPTQSCTRCQTPQKLHDRAAYRRAKVWYAPQPHVCQRCTQQAQVLARQRTALALEAELDHIRSQGALMDRLSLRDMVFLAALLRAGGTRELLTLGPTRSCLLTPTADFDERLLHHLLGKGLICVAPRSSPEFVRIEHGVIAAIDWHQVTWTLPLPDGGPAPADFLQMLEETFADSAWPEDWPSAAQQLRLSLAIEKCIQYLGVRLKHHRLPLAIGERTRSVLRSVLASFSMSQAYCFIWKACENAKRFRDKHRVSGRHAANTIPGQIEHTAKKAIDERWDVPAYRRDCHAPDSELCAVLFTSVLKLPFGGFFDAPAMYACIPEEDLLRPTCDASHS